MRIVLQVFILVLIGSSCNSSQTSETVASYKEEILINHQPDWRILKGKKILKLDTTPYYFKVIYIEDDRSSNEYERIKNLEGEMEHNIIADYLTSLDELSEVKNFKNRFTGTWIEIVKHAGEDYIYIPSATSSKRIRITENLYVESMMDGIHPCRIISLNDDSETVKIELKGAAHTIGKLDFKLEKTIKFEDEVIMQILGEGRFIRFENITKFKLLIDYTNNPTLGDDFIIAN